MFIDGKLGIRYIVRYYKSADNFTYAKQNKRQRKLGDYTFAMRNGE